MTAVPFDIFILAGSAPRPLRLPALFGLLQRLGEPICISMTHHVQPAPVAADPDRADVLAARGGDGNAYRRLVERYQNALAQRMRRFSRDAGEIEDLVHETFVQAYLSLHTFLERAPFEHWLNTIATRVGYAFLKQKVRRQKI